MKEYRVFEISCDPDDTQQELNDYAEYGWTLVCSYYKGKWLIMERDKKVCKECGK